MPSHVGPTSWSPPPCSSMKINVDASWRLGATLTWVGLVIRDSNRRCLEFRRVAVQASSMVVSESLAVLEGYRLALDLNIPTVVIESDSKKVISCLQDRSSSCVWELFLIRNRT